MRHPGLLLFAGASTFSILQPNQLTAYGKEIQVLSLEYYPLTPDGQNIDIAVTGDVGERAQAIRDRVATINTNLVQTLSQGTRFRGHTNGEVQPSLTYRIADTVRRDFAVPTVPKWGSYESPFADYVGIMSSIDICSLVASGISEVWLWAYNGKLGIYESHMAGPYGDTSNSYSFPEMPVCDSTYVVYTFNYARGTADAIHSYSHQLEREFMHLDRPLFDLWSGQDDDWKAPRERGVTARCGSVHKPPNGDGDYDYWDSTFWLSDCLDWNPDGLGTTSEMSCSTWGCTDLSDTDNAQLNYLVWWMQNVPGYQNGVTYKGAALRNWWLAHANFDEFNANGWSLSENPSAPPAPRNVVAQGISASQIQLTWVDISDESGYRVKRWNGVEFAILKDNLAPGSTSYTDSGLLPQQEYAYYVCAYNAAGESCNRDWVTSQTGRKGAPPAPRNVVAQGISASQIQLTWVDISNESGYRVKRWNGVEFAILKDNLAPGSTSYTDSGLLPQQEYAYYVCAYNAAGESCHRDWVSGQTDSKGAPPAPRNVVAQGISASQIQLTWVDISNESGYRVKRWNGAEFAILKDNLAPGSTSYTDSGLLPQQEYAYYVCAYNAAGESCNRDWVSGQTDRKCRTLKKPCNKTNKCCNGLKCTQNRCKLPCQRKKQICSKKNRCCNGLMCKRGRCIKQCKRQRQTCSRRSRCCAGLKGLRCIRGRCKSL